MTAQGINVAYPVILDTELRLSVYELVDRAAVMDAGYWTAAHARQLELSVHALISATPAAGGDTPPLHSDFSLCPSQSHHYI